MLGRFYSRFKRFKKRNDGRVFSAGWRFLVGRVYAKPIIRRVVSAFPGRAREPKKWAFLIGCYNSGTTILRDVLDAHPEVSCLPREGVVLTDAFPDLQAGGWIRMLYRNRDRWIIPNEGSEERAFRAKRDWSPLWSRRASVFLEKSITHSVRMPWLEESFDNPYFIVIRRNGYCVCEGIRRRAAPQGGARKEIGDSYPMYLLAEQWVAVNECIDQATTTLKNVHIVHYEQLVTDPFETVGAIYDFLELSRPVMKIINGNLHIGNKDFAIRDMNGSSLARLSEAERREAGEVMAHLFARYGYDV